MALSQCAALMEDVPHRRARSGLGPLGRDRLQGGTEAPGSRDAAPGAHRPGRRHARLHRTSFDKEIKEGRSKRDQHLFK